MDVMIRIVSRIMFLMIIVFGIYTALYGHLGPGGAFPAGVIIASGFAILLITHDKGKEFEIAKSMFTMRGIGLFLLIIFAMHSFGNALNSYLLGTQSFLELWSGGFTIFMNSFSVIFISMTLILIIYKMVKE